MAIGGLGAYWIFNGYKGIEAEKSKIWTVLFSKTSQILFLSATIGLLFFAKMLYNLDNFVGESYRFLFSGRFANIFTSLLFLYLILNTALNPKRLWNTEQPILNFLGEISYGLYMYHTVLLFFLMAIFKKYLFLLSPFQSTLLFYGVLFPLLIAVCWVSYQYFERWFLKWKVKWE
jgi:peptidoglycan/LPS O-acetylase OafA/YrhL